MSISEDTIVRVLVSQRARLLAYIWSIVRDGALVEDVFQEVSLLAVREREQLRNEAALETWLRRTARFKSLAALRDRGRRAMLLDESVLDQLEPQWDELTRHSTTEDYQVALTHCLSKLTPRGRRIVALRYIEGLKATEVAKRLSQKPRSLYQALSRIHATLRACVTRQVRTQEVDHD